jgi:thiamine-phosphate pyrophosphorylase
MDDLSEIYRIIDANANRAREALRVAEEAARFALERPDLAEALKRLRHDLRAALERLDARALLAARDTAGDVGTTVSTASERTRAGTADVARAAFKRLTEALRTVEEYGKALDAEMAAAVERLRYRAYDLEKRFEEATRPKGRLAVGGLCVLLTESLCRKPWQEVLRAVLAGGAAAVQVREKDMPDGPLLARAREVARAAHEAGALAIVNDRPDIAVLAAADGVHVGQDDLAPNEARRIVGPDRIVGVSTHSLAQAMAAAEAGADYVGCGPMFQSATKPQEVIPGPALAAEVARQVGLPVMAIGGITPENAPQVLAAGVRWLAVSSTVCSAADPEAETRRLATALSRARRGSGGT